jgi:hypothetical protein
LKDAHLFLRNAPFFVMDAHLFLRNAHLFLKDAYPFFRNANLLLKDDRVLKEPMELNAKKSVTVICCVQTLMKRLHTVMRKLYCATQQLKKRT